MKALVIILFVVGMAKIFIYDYFTSPKCDWCKARHYGRCIFNPRAGRFLANTNDGHFDYSDPNK